MFSTSHLNEMNQIIEKSVYCILLPSLPFYIIFFTAILSGSRKVPWWKLVSMEIKSHNFYWYCGKFLLVISEFGNICFCINVTPDIRQFKVAPYTLLENGRSLLYTQLLNNSYMLKDKESQIKK